MIYDTVNGVIIRFYENKLKGRMKFFSCYREKERFQGIALHLKFEMRTYTVHAVGWHESCKKYIGVLYFNLELYILDTLSEIHNVLIIKT